MIDLTGGVLILAAHHLPLPVLGAGLAVENVAPGGTGANGLWLPLVLVILLVLATVPAYAPRRAR